MKISALALLLATSTLANTRASDLTIHEWGTFTSLQDEAGNAIGGINTDDEPVPPFVHDLARMLLIRPTDIPPVFCQGAPQCHPDVTMRLETPVLYVHAPESFHGPLDVSVTFHGGWLTQFYPQADAITPGVEPGQVYGRLTSETKSKLSWPDLTVNAQAPGPDTNEHVWLAPRAVAAQPLQARGGETEKFLFYRGVGHLDAPLRVVRSTNGATLNIQQSHGQLDLDKLWLVDIRPDGTAAWRTFMPVSVPLFASTPATFAAADYSADRAQSLRADLKTALLADGLFADEADALLNTWELSYFKSAGLRLFFLVPQTWTDRVLPLKISGAPAIKRVMVGRIELVTPRQRELIARIATDPAPDPSANFESSLMAATLNAGRPDAWNDLFAGKRTFASIGFTPPAAWQAYLDLGRFRNALLLDEERRHGNAKISQFIKTFGLAGYQVPAPDIQ